MEITNAASAEDRSAETHRVTGIPLDLIDDFPDHPFRVSMDWDMQQLVESIRSRGLIAPVILRKKEGGRYEIVSGHRRKKACEIAGLTEIPAEVREMTRDEAIVMMVESNLQRSRILPSEKAFAYRMRLEALKRQGARSDLTSAPLGPKLDIRSNIELANEVGDSTSQIKRYIRLTMLHPEILDMVDEGKIGMRPAVEISYLTDTEQEKLLDIMQLTDCTPSHAQAIRLRTLSRQGVLVPGIMNAILNEEKPNQKEHISLRYEEAMKYIPPDVPLSMAADYVLKALEFYKRYQERQRSGREAR